MSFRPEPQVGRTAPLTPRQLHSRQCGQDPLSLRQASESRHGTHPELSLVTPILQVPWLNWDPGSSVWTHLTLNPVGDFTILLEISTCWGKTKTKCIYNFSSRSRHTKFSAQVMPSSGFFLLKTNPQWSVAPCLGIRWQFVSMASRCGAILIKCWQSSSEFILWLGD